MNKDSGGRVVVGAIALLLIIIFAIGDSLHHVPRRTPLMTVTPAQQACHDAVSFDIQTWSLANGGAYPDLGTQNYLRATDPSCFGITD